MDEIMRYISTQLIILIQNQRPVEIVRIYTDGACRGNPGPGGWGAVLTLENHHREIQGSARETTNNRMELTAAIQALEVLKRSVTVELFSDSSYVVKGMTEWLPNWKKLGWKRKKGELLNADLWQRLDELASRHRVTWHWIKGHSGQRYNERADQLANDAIDNLKNE